MLVYTHSRAEVDAKQERRYYRYTVVQDAASNYPSYVEGQYQVGQQYGWALNEEYIYGDETQMRL